MIYVYLRYIEIANRLLMKKYIYRSGAVCLLILGACTKNGDKKGPDISNQLHRKYCNIPAAVNYNWNFPGIEDNATCFFATSFYEGNWVFIDTVKNHDETVLRIDTIGLYFQKKEEDASYQKMYMTGWCSSEKLLIHVDRFYMARTDSFDNNMGWQKICNDRDSLFVEMRKSIYDTTQLTINITQYSPTSVLFHSGTGIRK